MKKNLIAIIAVCTLATAAFADETPPPPPDQPTESGGSGLRSQGALFDASTYDARPMLLSAHGYLPYHSFGIGYFPIGVGASFYIPLVKNGFISSLNDEFGIDFGLDAIARIGSAYPFSLHIPVGVQWKFHILPNLEAYAKLGIQVDLWFGFFGGYLPLWPVGMVGAHYFFSKGFGLKLEAGSTGVRFGEACPEIAQAIVIEPTPHEA